MNVFLLRHAHRDKPEGGRLDNGLSLKGEKQRKRLVRTLLPRLKEFDSVSFYSSPKKRCQETVDPLARKMKVKVEILGSLDVSDDTDLDAIARATIKFLGQVKSECVVLSVYGEWTEAFFKTVIGVEIELDKAGWAELERSKRGNFRLLSVIPESMNG